MISKLINFYFRKQNITKFIVLFTIQVLFQPVFFKKYSINENLLNLGQSITNLPSQTREISMIWKLTAETVAQRYCVKKVALRNFAKFAEKHLCQSLFFNKVAGLRPATLLKKRLWHKCLTANFAKFLRTPFSIEHLRWLLLERVTRFVNSV